MMTMPEVTYQSRIGVLSFSTVLILLLYLSFGADVFNAVVYKAAGENGYISKISRGCLEAWLIFILVRQRQFVPLYIVATFTLLNIFGLFIVYVLEGASVITGGEIFQNIIIVNKFLLIILLFYVFKSYLDNPKFIENLFRFFEFSFFVYVLSIFVGYAFNVELFEAYPGKIRFGYRGVIVTQNEAVGLFLIGMFYFFIKYKEDGRLTTLFYLNAIFVAGFLVGSKACMVFLSLAWLRIHFGLARKKMLWVFAGIAVPLLFVFDWEAFVVKLEGTRDYIIYFYEKGDSLLSIVLTGRNWRVEHLIDQLFNHDHYSWFNYIFGGFNFSRLGTEMDFFDVLTLFGLGGFCYYVIYIRMLFILSGYSRELVWFLCLFLIASTLGGHLIYNAVIPAYLLIMCVRMGGYSTKRSSI